jgi:hypothetical protein
VFGFALCRVSAVFRLGASERVAWRRNGLAYRLKDGTLARFLACLAGSCFQPDWARLFLYGRQDAIPRARSVSTLRYTFRQANQRTVEDEMRNAELTEGQNARQALFETSKGDSPIGGESPFWLGWSDV